MTPLPVVLPAAGRGTRLRAVAPDTPKVLLPLGGRPMIDWCLDELRRCGLREVAVVVDALDGPVADHVIAHDLVSRVVEQAEPAGIADAILRARVCESGPFVLALPDVIDRAEEPALTRLLAAHAASGQPGLVALTQLDAEAAARWGNCGRAEVGPEDEHGRRPIQRLADKGDGAMQVDGPVWVTAPRCVLDEAFLVALTKTAPTEGEHDDVPAFQRLIAEGALFGVEVGGPLLDVGNPAGYEAARRALGGE